jgi:hypothetical protein
VGLRSAGRGACFARQEILDLRQPASAGRFSASASLGRFCAARNPTRMDAAGAEEVVRPLPWLAFYVVLRSTDFRLFLDNRYREDGR